MGNTVTSTLNLGPFINYDENYYASYLFWSSTDWSSGAWTLNFSVGGNQSINSKNDLNFAWAVRDGDVDIVCITPPAGLVSWWPGNGNASDIVDGNHGTLQGGTTYGAGMVGQAFSFDGIDDFVQVPDSDLWAFTGDFTIEMWVNFNSVPGGTLIFPSAL